MGKEGNGFFSKRNKSVIERECVPFCVGAVPHLAILEVVKVMQLKIAFAGSHLMLFTPDHDRGMTRVHR